MKAEIKNKNTLYCKELKTKYVKNNIENFKVTFIRLSKYFHKSNMFLSIQKLYYNLILHILLQ